MVSTIPPDGAADRRPSDRAGPAERGGRTPDLTPPGRHPSRVALLSVHTSPLAQPGTGDSGGMNVYLAAVAGRLARRGIEVDVYTRAEGRDLPPTVSTNEGVRVHHLHAGPPGSRKQDLTNHLCAFSFALNAHPRFARADVVHGHYWLSGWVARRLSRRRRIPFVQTFHTLAREKNAALAAGDVPDTMLRIAAEERIATSADAVVAPTRHEAAVLREAYGAPATAVRVIPPGVDLSVFTPGRDRRRDRQVLGGGRLLLFVGRLQPLKAPDVAICTLAALDALLPDDGVPTRLLVCGGASGSGVGRTDVPRLRALAAELGVADRVAFLAPRPQAELAALYRAADVVLMPSRSESFGLVALEAQACGTPVVAAASGGLRHAVARGGAVVEGHDPAAHAAAAAPLLTDARLRADAGRAAVGHARRHSWERTTDAMVELYTEVLATAGGQRHGPAADDSRDAFGA